MGEFMPEPLPARSKEGISNMIEQGEAGMGSGKEREIWIGFTSFDFVGFSVVSNIWSLGFGDFHLTIFLSFSDGKILLVPL